MSYTEVISRLKGDSRWDEFAYRYQMNLANILQSPPQEFKIYRSDMYRDDGICLPHHIDFECSFAARMISEEHPKTILDIGSYRHFIIGLLAGYEVTSVDVRQRISFFEKEKILTGDAKDLKIDSASFDLVMSLCSIEHFGLGRYGDEFDLEADLKAVEDMHRVLKPGGSFLFSVPITRGVPCLFFNAHRIYDYDMISCLCEGMSLVRESFFTPGKNKECDRTDIADVEVDGIFSVYCGCWRKA